MHASPGAGHSGSTASLERDALSLEKFLDKYRYAVLLALTVFYTAGAVWRARGKPFWYDEIITLIVARSHDWAGTWKAALACDANPPLPHLLTHWSIGWFGESEVTARLPAMVGFWIFCLCLFYLVRKRTNMYYGIAALLLPTATEAFPYSVEARAYGPELAFCGLALVAWQASADGRGRRVLTLPMLAVSLTGAIFCHYYAILMYIPLAGGELMRTMRERRIDFGIWAAMAAGGVPLLLRLATIRSVIQGFTHTWATPSVAQILAFWELGLPHFLTVFVILLAIGGLATVAARHQAAPEESKLPAPADHELFAGVLFLAVPGAAVMLAFLVTHSYSERYTMFAMTGFALLLPMLTAYWTRGRALVGLLLAAASLAPLVLSALGSPPPRNPYQEETLLHAALERAEVVIPDGQLFLQLWYYAPERLRSRLIYLADDEAALKYMGFDTIEGGLLVLRPWAAVNVVEYKSFAPAGGEFLAYQSTPRPGWVLFQALAEGAQVEVLSGDKTREMLRIRLKASAAAAVPRP